MILAILLVGLGLRLVSLNQSLWLDEAISVKAVRDFSFGGIISQFSPGDFHPPLYYLLLKVWAGVMGLSEVGVRMLSVVLGMATVYLVFEIGKQWLGRRAGLVAAVLLATSPLAVYYSQEARMYVMASFLVCLGMWFYGRAVKEKQFALLNWVLLALAWVLVLYTDYLPGLMFLVLALGLVVFDRKILGEKKWVWLAVFGGVAVLFLPWWPTLSGQLNLGAGVKSSAPGWWQVLGGVGVKQLVLVPVKFVIGRISFYNKFIYGGFAVAAMLPFVLGLILSLKKIRETGRFWVWLVVPLAVGWVLSFKLAVFSYFRFLFVLPAFYLLAAAGMGLIKNSGARKVCLMGAIVVNLVCSSIYLSNGRFQRENWRRAVAFMESESVGKKAAAIFVTKNQRDAFFYYAKYMSSYGPEGLNFGPFDRLWLVRYVQPIFDPSDNLRKQVEEGGYRKVDERDFNGVGVFGYEKK